MNERMQSRGFVLIEAILSLIIAVGAGIIITWTITVVTNQQSDGQINFFRYVNVIEDKKFSFRVVSVTNEAVKLYSPVTSKTYHLEKYKNMIRLTGETMGHVRLLSSVKDCRFSYKKGLISNVQLENGRHYHAISNF
ncbi:competence type IV pilus minor pilin ComGF [Lentilactobacillus sp. Marseille-Q4993]|uniref:competence type IV pilus minor pilin ComGF n=1 Tax=Lentilactobacillus sp. Marseille-Q4993 TaxID=3039492 RepID=UPI0024BCB14B|nr:competence type IV pilus minor pilin ComGF [Lentilactobacillus sp. Marseille-Q4993]